MSQREAWFAGQLDLAPAGSMFMNEIPMPTKISSAMAAADEASGCG